MTLLEEVTPDTGVRGILPDKQLIVVKTNWIGSDAIGPQYPAAEGHVSVTLQIDASAGTGFSDKTVSDGTENGLTLQFMCQKLEEQ